MVRHFLKQYQHRCECVIVLLVITGLFSVDVSLNQISLQVPKAQAATFTMQTGYYMGDAADDRAITGLGFSPDLVMIKDETADGSDGVVFRTSAMTGDSASTLADPDANKSNNIQSFESDGFTIGNDADVNTTNVRYVWIAFGGSDCSASGTFCVGSYTGNGTSQSITSVGFQPDLVVVKLSGTQDAVWKSSAMSGTNSSFFVASADTTTAITSLDSTGFTVGAAAQANTNGSQHWFFAFTQVSDFMDVGTYTGNGADDRNITSSDDAGLTFQPDFVWTKVTTATEAVGSITEHYGDRSFPFSDTISAQNNIQQLRTAGGFQVGTSANVNTNASVYNYAAFGGAADPTATGTFTVANGSYVGTGSSFSITGLGFAPDLVIIKHHDQATDQYAVWRSRVMKGDSSTYFGNSATNFTGGITVLDADGFTLGTSATVNTSGDTYYWVAFGNAWRPDAPASSQASDLAIGAYVANEVTATNINRLPFQPDFVTIKRFGPLVGTWTTSNVTAGNSLFFTGATQATDRISALTSDGFQIGLQNEVSVAGDTYWYFMFKTGNRFSVNNYTGTGSSQNVTNAGFQPDYLWIKKSTGGTARAPVLRTSAQSGDAAQPFLNSATIANAITNLISGGFTVNTAVETNENTFVYRYAAWDSKYYAQQAYRFYENADSTDIGTALAAADTAATTTSSGAAFRLRILMRVDNGNLFASGQDFKLQFAARSGTCDTSFSGESYSDVTGATTIAYTDNATPADGDALTPNGGSDPTDGGRTIVNQTYEEANNFTNSQGAINSGQDGKWDFALIDNGAPADTTYCFRIVKSSGALLDTYTVIPQITTASNAAGTLTFSISNNTAAFGTLSSAAARYASSTAAGDPTETVAHTLTASTNATNGYVLTVQGATLTSAGGTIDAIGGTSAASNPGTEQFGLRITASGGDGSVSSPYNHASNYAYAADASTPDDIASDANGNDVPTVYSVRYLGNITPQTEAGSYATVLTYVLTAAF